MAEKKINKIMVEGVNYIVHDSNAVHNETSEVNNFITNYFKTINGKSLAGPGNLVIEGGSGGGSYILPPAGEDLGGVKTGGDVTISEGIINLNKENVATIVNEKIEDGTITVVAEIPIADTEIGGVKEGGDIDIDSYGVMTLNTSSISNKVVTSVNGQHGEVTINIPEEYILPVADQYSLGGVKEGGDINVDSYGVMTLNTSSISNKVVTSVNGQHGDIEIAKKVNSYSEAQAYATSEHTGNLVYLSKKDNQYEVGLYVVIGSGLLNKLAQSSASGDIEADLNAHVSNNDIHVPNTNVGDNNKYFTVVDGKPKFIDASGEHIKLTNYNESGQSGIINSTDTVNIAIAKLSNETKKIPTQYVKSINNKQDNVTITNKSTSNISINETENIEIELKPGTSSLLGGIKSGADINIDDSGIVTVTSGTNHSHTSVQITDLQDKLDAKADKNIIGDGFNTGSTVSQQLTALKSTTDNHIENDSIHVPFTGTTGYILKKTELGSEWSEPYTLPVADTTTLGGVKEGGDIDIDSSGVMTLNAVKLSEKAIVSISNRAFKEPLCGHIILADIDGKAILGDSENPPTDIVLPKSGGDIDVDESGLMTINDSKLEEKLNDKTIRSISNISFKEPLTGHIILGKINGKNILGNEDNSVEDIELPGRYTGSGLNKGVVFGDYSRNTAGKYTIANGTGVNASGMVSFASGQTITSTGTGTLSIGNSITNNNDYSTALGRNLITGIDYQTVIGISNNDNVLPSPGESYAFIIGNGSLSTSDKSNAFTVSNKGNVKAQGTISGSRADYAEMFEWEDGNINNEDRVGYFVTLHNGKIKFANKDSKYILGIVSSTPQIIGNEPMDWHDKYLKDNFGRTIYDKTEYVDPETNKKIIDYIPRLNPKFNQDAIYEFRINRKEWAPIGMLGQLYVRQDGTLKVNEFCKPNDEGIATYSESGYFVLEIINENIAKVIFK